MKVTINLKTPVPSWWARRGTGVGKALWRPFVFLFGGWLTLVTALLVVTKPIGYGLRAGLSVALTIFILLSLAGLFIGYYDLVFILKQAVEAGGIVALFVCAVFFLTFRGT